jgi:hypothetical protein
MLGYPAEISLHQIVSMCSLFKPVLYVCPFLNTELQIWNAFRPRNVFAGSWMWQWISLSVDWTWVRMRPPEGWAVCIICMGWPIILAQRILDITRHIASILTRANGMNIMTQGEISWISEWCVSYSDLCTVTQILCTGYGTCEEKKNCVVVFWDTVDHMQ